MILRSMALLLIVGNAAQAAQHFDGSTWWDTVKVIADDKFEGRDTGSKGERAAQQYIVDRLEALGVEPAGSNGYYQPVRFRSLQIAEAGCRLALIRDGQAQAITLGEQAIFTT